MHCGRCSSYVDFETVEGGEGIEPETVTVRDRDSMEQVRLPISELAAYIRKNCEF